MTNMKEKQVVGAIFSIQSPEKDMKQEQQGETRTRDVLVKTEVNANVSEVNVVCPTFKTSEANCITGKLFSVYKRVAAPNKSPGKGFDDDLLSNLKDPRGINKQLAAHLRDRHVPFGKHGNVPQQQEGFKVSESTNS